MKVIRCPEDLEVALSRIEELFNAQEGTLEDDELSALFALVEAYEAETVPIPGGIYFSLSIIADRETNKHRD